MKKNVVACLCVLFFGAFISPLFAQEKEEVDTIEVLEEKQELLDLHRQKTKLQIKLLKKQFDCEEKKQKAKYLEELADKATQDYQDLDSKQSKENLAHSKETRKILSKSEKANNKLSKCLKQIRDLEDDIRNVERKIAMKGYCLEINEKK